MRVDSAESVRCLRVNGNSNGHRRPRDIATPLVIALIALASWALRPPRRRLVGGACLIEGSQTILETANETTRRPAMSERSESNGGDRI
jgi:hypothetical protein